MRLGLYLFSYLLYDSPFSRYLVYVSFRIYFVVMRLCSGSPASASVCRRSIFCRFVLYFVFWALCVGPSVRFLLVSLRDLFPYFRYFFTSLCFAGIAVFSGMYLQLC